MCSILVVMDDRCYREIFAIRYFERLMRRRGRSLTREESEDTTMPQEKGLCEC